MLTIKVNGREEKLNIGCRTFIALDELLRIFETTVQQVTLNGEAVPGHEFAQTSVKGGDALSLK